MRGYRVLAGLAAIAISAAGIADSGPTVTWTPAQIASGESTRFAAAGPDGDAWATEQQKGQILRIAADGSVTRFPLPAGVTPGPITSGPDGNLWFTAVQGSGGGVSVLGRMTTAGVLTIFPYPNPSAFLPAPPSASIAGSSDGFVYAADAPSERIGKINPANGAVTEILVGHAPGDLAALPDGSLAIAEPVSGHFAARLINGVVSQVNIPGGVLPNGVSACTFAGADGFCVVDSHGFQSNVLVECSLAGVCTPYPIDTNQCSAQQLACLGGACYLATPFCQEIVQTDMSKTPPASSTIEFPAGFNASEIHLISPGQLVAVGQDTSSGDYHVFRGQRAGADLSVTQNTIFYARDGFSTPVFKVANLGPMTALSVVVTVTGTPAALYSLTSDSPAVSCDASSGKCVTAELDPGDRFFIQPTYPFTEQPLQVNVQVSSAISDPDPSNNKLDFVLDTTPYDFFFVLGALASPPGRRGPK